MRNTLIKRIAANATPKQRLYEISHCQVDGLLMRVQPSGHKSWVVTWARGKRRALGSVEHLTLDQARDAARTTVAKFV